MAGAVEKHAGRDNLKTDAAQGILHEGLRMKAKFTFVHASKKIGQAVLNNFEHCEWDSVTTNPLQFYEAQCIRGKVDEVDTAFVVGTGVCETRGNRTLVEPARHVPIFSQRCNGLLKHLLAAPVALSNVCLARTTPKLIGRVSGITRKVLSHPAIKPFHEGERAVLRKRCELLGLASEVLTTLDVQGTANQVVSAGKKAVGHRIPVLDSSH